MWLHHADNPSLYQGLPNRPRISPLVSVWKGGAKVFGMAMIGLAAVGSFIHYITIGPNEVPETAEAEAVRLEREGSSAANRERSSY